MKAKKKYRSVYFKEESLWDLVEKMAEDEQRSVNGMLEIIVKRGIEQNNNVLIRNIKK